MKKHVLLLAWLLLLLMGCSPRSSDNENSHSDKGGDQAKVPPYKTIQELEDNGLVPALDRSDSLGGVDRDGDGVRDDIAKYIADEKLEEKQEEALRYLAYVLRKTLLIDLSDSSALENEAKQMARAVNCIYTHFTQPGEASRYIKNIQAQTANTKNRFEKYMNYSQSNSGTVLNLPSGDTCEKH